MTANLWKPVSDGIALRVRATPNAAKNAIKGIYVAGDGKMSLRVTTTAQPEKGKANKAVIAILAKRFGCAKSLLEVTGGHTQRNKTVVICGDREDIKSWLIPALEGIENV